MTGIDLSLRNALIERYLGRGGVSAAARLTEDDRRDIAAARAMNMHEAPPSAAAGVRHFDFGPLMAVIDRIRPGNVNIAPLFQEPERYAALPPAAAFEELLRRERAAALPGKVTVGLVEFFDGNLDSGSLGNLPAAVGFEKARSTLLAIAALPEVIAAGVSINDVPNPNHPGDDSVWLAAEEVYLWTRQPLKVVREWCRPLAPDWAVKVPLRTVKPPVDGKFPPKTIAVRVGWD